MGVDIGVLTRSGLTPSEAQKIKDIVDTLSRKPEEEPPKTEAEEEPSKK